MIEFRENELEKKLQKELLAKDSQDTNTIQDIERLTEIKLWDSASGDGLNEENGY